MRATTASTESVARNWSNPGILTRTGSAPFAGSGSDHFASRKRSPPSTPRRRFDYLIRQVKTLPLRHEGGSIRLEPDGTGTNAVWTSSFEIPIPVIGGAMDRIFKRQLERGFARVLERSAELSTQTSLASA